MADAFRGLTLRIGADARPVQSALSSISASASQTQRQLNKMSKALKFDNTNLGALRQAIALADDKASHMAMSMRTAALAMKQAATESAGFGKHSEFNGMTIAEAARNIKNVNSQIQQTREQAKSTNGQLQHIYDSAKKIVETRLHAPFATAEQKAKLADDVIKQIQKDLTATGPKADSAFEAMNKFITKATMDPKMNLAKKFGLAKTEEDANKLYETFVRLHYKSGELDSDLKALKNVGGFQALKTEVLAYESSLREAVAETVRYKAELASIGSVTGLARAVSDLKGIKAATSAATEHARVMDEAYRALPRSIEQARSKILATKNAQKSLTQQADALRAAMRRIEGSEGFDKMAASSGAVYAEFEKAKAAATDAAVAVEKVESRIKQLNHQKLAFIGPQSESELKQTEKQVEKLNSELTELRLKASSADKALSVAASNKQYADMATDLARVNTELAELNARSSVLNKFKNLGAGMRELGYGLYSTVTPAIMMAGRYAIQAAEDIDSSYRDMRKTVNGTEEQFEHLRQAAMDYSTTHVTSADQILEIEAMGGQLGLAATDLEAFATTISNLDIATNIDADTAAEQLGKMASVLGITSDEYDNFGDSLVRLGNNMPVMESDIMALMTRYMGMGKVVGMSADEMLGWSAAASATGQKAEAAGSSMQRFISNVETAITGGGENLEKFASIAGMTADDFAQKFRDDASGAMRDFVAGLGEMQKNGESVNQALKELGINNVRDKQLLEGLAVQMANATDELSTLDYALQLSSEAYNGFASETKDGGIEKAGDAAREAARKAEGFSGALQMMRNQAQVLGATLADGAAPYLRDLGVMLADLTDKFRSMPDSMQTAAVGALAFAAAIGPVSVAAGTTLRAITSIVGAIAGVGSIVVGASAKMEYASNSVKAFGMEMSASAGKVTKGSEAMYALGNAMSMLGTPAGLVSIAGAVALVGGSFAYIVKGIADAQARIDTFNKATDGLDAAVDRMGTALGTAMGSYDEFGKKVLGAEYAIDKMPGVIDRAAQSQAELVDKMNERTEATRSEIGQLNLAEAVLEKYLNKTGLTAEEQGKLRAAIELLNGTYGAHLSVVDAANGKVADEKGALLGAADAIRQFIEQKKQQIQVESLSASYQEAEAQRLERLKELTGQQANIEWLKQQRDQFAENSEGWNEYNGYIQEAITYYGKLKDMYDSDASAADALAERMGLVSKQAQGAKLTIGESVKASAEWGMVIDAFSADMNEFAASLDRAGVNEEQFAKLGVEDMMKVVAAWQTGGDSIQDALDSVGVGTRSLAQQFSDVFDAAGANINDFGGNIDTLAETLSNAGISAQEFSDMGIEKFGELYAAAEGDLTNLGVLLNALNDQNIDPKTVHFNGDEIETTKGQVYELQTAADEAGNKTYTLNLTANASQAQGSVEGAQAVADEWGASEETASINEEGAEDSEDAISSAQDAADTFGSTSASATISATDYASDVIDSVARKLAALDGSSATVTINEGGNASGGILARYNASGALASRFIKAIPRNADGGLNGIVTRPTLTNIGWVGEAGAEAVMHMKNAGGAVVPLTNRRYVRPFARAVASEMGGGRSVNVTVNLDYKAGDDASRMARDVANRVEAYLSMGA